ncbi:MAG TPA: hypothetical protein VHD31_03420 [Candidatus Paceibacterota bacterium]|nr:hypothetical protein [Candidatus Paceibacterota bacterium]
MNRRQFLVSGGSLFALALGPSITMAVPVAPFVPPTTNIVHLAGRIASLYSIPSDDLLHILGLNPDQVEKVKEEAAQAIYADENRNWLNPEKAQYYAELDGVHSLAEGGNQDIYERARLVIDIKRKMNTRFNFDRVLQTDWLYWTNPHLKGMTFHEVMKADLRLAAEVVDLALQG